MPVVNYDWDEIEDNIDEEYDDEGNTIVEYTTEPTLYGPVVSQNRGGVTSHYHYDGQGNTTELTNDAGAVTDTRRYSAFGEIMQNTGSTVFPFQYGGCRGYYLDELLGYICIRCRCYSPLISRWLSYDPLGFLQDSPNQFDYVQNSPLRSIDLGALCGARGQLLPAALSFLQAKEKAVTKEEFPEHCPKDALDKKCECDEVKTINSRVSLVSKILGVKISGNSRSIQAEILFCIVTVECCRKGVDKDRTYRLLGAGTAATNKVTVTINLPANITPTEDNKEALANEWFGKFPCWRANTGAKIERPCLNKVAQHCLESFK